MKKNIIIGILSIATVVSVVFGIYQRTLAQRNAMEAMRLQTKAEAAAVEAMRQATIAKENAMEAIRQKDAAEAEHQKLTEELTKSRKTK